MALSISEKAELDAQVEENNKPQKEFLEKVVEHAKSTSTSLLDLKQRVDALEMTVGVQQQTISSLINTIKSIKKKVETKSDT